MSNLNKFLQRIIIDGDTTFLVKNILPFKWLLPSDQELFSKFRDHISKYGYLPTEEVYFKWAEPVVVNEPVAYYFDLVKHDYFLEQVGKIRGISKNISFEEMRSLIGEVSLNLLKIESNLVEYSADADRLIENEKAFSGLKIKTGYKLLDGGGGFSGGDVVSIVGRTNQGKSTLVLWIASRMALSGRNVFFVNPEMKPPRVFSSLKKMLKGGGGLSSKFHLLSGKDALSLPYIFQAARETNSEVVILDSAYFLHVDSKRTLSSTEKLSMLVDQIHLYAVEYQLPVFCTWQYNRDYEKNGANASPSQKLTNIAGSDRIGQNSELVVDIETTSENTTAKLLTIIKSRNGVWGKVRINWDWYKMDFSDGYKPDLDNYL